MNPTQSTTEPTTPRPASDTQSMRVSEFRTRRAFWPGLLGAAVIGGGAAAMLVSNYYDDRTLGARVDATVAAAGSKVNDGVADLRGAASGAAQGTAEAADRLAGVVADAVITAAVKTALAADPSLSAVKIDVSTTHGSVLLAGPAPDAKSRQRAETLAMAPKGVVGVDNRLVVPAASAMIAAKAGLPPSRAPAPATASPTPSALSALAPEVVKPAEPPVAPASPTAPPGAAPASPGTPTNQ